MFIKQLHILSEKPEAFKDREDIEYVHISFEGLEFMSWAIYSINFKFQIPKGYRNLSGLLDYIFSKLIPINTLTYFPICIKNSLLEKTDWSFKGGVEPSTDMDRDYCSWDKRSYRRELKTK